MSKAKVNVSGVEGSGTSVRIYETPDYEYPWQGACIMHGSFTMGPASPDNQRIEVVELNMPGIEIRVKADDVRGELRALYAANKVRREEDSPDKLDCRHGAFDDLRSAVIGLVGRHITVKHIEMIVRAAFDDGARQGEERVRAQFRNLLRL